MTARNSVDPVGVYLKHEQGKEWFVPYNPETKKWGKRERHDNPMDAVKVAIDYRSYEEALKHVTETLSKEAYDGDAPFYKSDNEVLFSERWEWNDDVVWKNTFGTMNIDTVLADFNEAYKAANPAPVEPAPAPAPAPVEAPASELEGLVRDWNSKHATTAVKSLVLAQGQTYNEQFKTMLAPYGKVETNLSKAKTAGILIENYDFVIFPGSAPGKSTFIHEQNGNKYIIIYATSSYGTNTEGIKKAVAELD